MAPDSVTEVTSQSWFSRIGGAIKGVVVGLFLFVLAIVLLFWNEGRTVKQYKTLQEGGSAVVSVESNSVDAANDGKLVHISGLASTEATLSDDVFGVSVSALKLKRQVEMYQWEESSHSETKEKLGGGTEEVTTYTYSKGWSSSVIDSGSFKESAGHENPGSMPYESSVQVAEPIMVGAYTLSPALVDSIDDYEALPPSDDATLPASLQGRAQLQGATYYIGDDPSSPQVGDARVTFQVAPPGDVSVIAQQSGDTFVPYKTKAGGSIVMLQTGVRSAEEMIQAAQDSNNVLKWVLRVAGFIVMLLGLNMILRPFSVVADVVPFLGRIVGAGTGFIAFLISAVVSLMTISIAWVFYRPLIGLAILAVAIALVAAVVWKLRSAKPATQT